MSTPALARSLGLWTRTDQVREELDRLFQYEEAVALCLTPTSGGQSAGKRCGGNQLQGGPAVSGRQSNSLPQRIAGCACVAQRPTGFCSCRWRPPTKAPCHWMTIVPPFRLDLDASMTWIDANKSNNPELFFVETQRRLTPYGAGRDKRLHALREIVIRQAWPGHGFASASRRRQSRSRRGSAPVSRSTYAGRPQSRLAAQRVRDWVMNVRLGSIAQDNVTASALECHAFCLFVPCESDTLPFKALKKERDRTEALATLAQDRRSLRCNAKQLMIRRWHAGAI
jgi:hypothetical protein